MSPATPGLWKGRKSTIYRDLPSRVDTDATFGFIERCLQQCLETHTGCTSAQEFVFTPKRLLQTNLHGRTIRVVTLLTEHTPRYDALSYCWGSQKPLSTTRKTIRSKQEAIDWNDLPSVFQDAITVTNRLGIHYIWIDSLCIVQDDELDWAEQSSKMGRIYQGAFVTIAAAQSEDSRQGFLGAGRECVTHYSTDSDGRIAAVRIRKAVVSGIHFHILWDDSSHDVAWCDLAAGAIDALDTRGWALQESDLATRRIVYSNGEVQWTCKVARKCECIDEGPDRTVDFGPRTLSLLHYSETWRGTVLDISARKFTYEIDKTTCNIRNCVRAVSRRELKVTWHPGSAATMLTIVVDAACVPTTSDPFGRVSEGYIKLFGPVRTGWICFQHTDAVLQLRHRTEWFAKTRSFSADGLLEPVRNVFCKGEQHTVCRSEDVEQKPFDWTPVKYLLWQKTDISGLPYYDALVLGVSKRKPGCYERLGIVHMRLSRRRAYLAGQAEEANELVTII
ncbi:HET-domain-containing protein [Bimuria novae-zelandiae CBS 107.79]|uniref:HET-domain-containing protein n=1 Tax=Bimuria novae-zelandiae CBS 107.79 TaxID=1447943 RepID=A0A6A5VKC7_9PLEO|nr:HET-domain-containing protein [Bimuria novae-zelandiae CBS 107.79]